jgi:hypothetical protein
VSAISDLLKGGGVGQQLLTWGVLNQLIGGAMQPVAQELLQIIYPELPSVPLDPATAADLVLKGWWDHGAGEAEAKRTGVNPDRFADLVNNAGEPLSLDMLMAALRRGILEWDKGAGGPVSVVEGIRQSRLRNEWADVARELQWIPVPVADAADAVVENQITYDQGVAFANANGVKPEDFRILVNTRGNPPSPGQLITLYRRGIIPLDGTGPDVLSVQQGIAEGATKDKWWRHVADLATYIPPPRTVTALERSGVITPTQAAAYYADSGLDATLAAYYSANASSDKVSHHKQLAESQILDLYEAHTLTTDQATPLLEALGYTPEECAYILSLRDVSRSIKAVNGAISKVQNYYLARKLSTGDASSALDALGVAPAHRDELIGLWQLERGANVRILTQAEITAAFGAGIMDQPTAQTYLESLGYSPFDAWTLLSIKHKAALPDQPTEGATVSDRAL